MTAKSTHELVDAYLAAESGKWSPPTRRAYEYALRVFAGYLLPRRLGPDLLTTDDLNGYFVWLAEGKKKATVGQHLSAVRGFFAWLAEQGQLNEDAAARAHPPTFIAAPTPHAELSEDDCERIDTANFHDTAWPARDRALVHLILHTGIHVNETVSLMWNDVDLQRRVLRVPIRHGRVREVPLDDVAAASLLELRRETEVLGALFPNKRDGQAMSERSVNAIVRASCEGLGLPGVSPKTLRLTFVQRQLRAGHRLDAVARRAGYAAKNNVRRAVGALGPGVADCERCAARPDIGPIERRCKTCLGTGTLVSVTPGYRRRLRRGTAAQSMRRWSLSVRRTVADLPRLGVRDGVLARALGHDAFLLLVLANELENIDVVPEPGFVDPRAGPPVEAHVVQRLRADGQEARKLALAFEEVGWLDANGRRDVRRVGANLVLLAWAIEERCEGFEPWPERSIP